MALTQIELTSPTLSNGMRSDSGIKFEDVVLFGSGIYQNADGSLYGKDASFMCADTDGNFYFSDLLRNQIQKFNPDGTFNSKLSVANRPFAPFWDETTQKLYYSTNNDKKLNRCDADFSNIESSIANSEITFETFRLNGILHMKSRTTGNIYTIADDLTGSFSLVMVLTRGKSRAICSNGTHFLVLGDTYGTYAQLYDSSYSLVTEINLPLTSAYNESELEGTTKIFTDRLISAWDGTNWIIGSPKDSRLIKLHPTTLDYVGIFINGWTGSKGSLPRINHRYDGYGAYFGSLVQSEKFYTMYGWGYCQGIPMQLNQTAIWQKTATESGTLEGFQVSGEALHYSNWFYQIASGGWVSVDINTIISVAVASGELVELKAVGGDFDQIEKDAFVVNSVYENFNETVVVPTPEIPVITSPTDGATITIYDDEVTEISVTCENTAQILKVYDDGVDTGVSEYHASGTTHTIPGVPCSAGEHIFTVKAMSTDGTKLSAASDSVTITAGKESIGAISMPLEAIISQTRTTLIIS